MNNDLDWLARNYTWEVEDTSRVFLAKYISNGVCENLIFYARKDQKLGVYYNGEKFTDAETFTKEQWENRRSELRNKPNWESAPDWACWLAQDTSNSEGIGHWWWLEHKPNNTYFTCAMKGKIYPTEHRGEIIGNWGDTVEERPALKTVDKEIKYLEHLLSECYPYIKDIADWNTHHAVGLVELIKKQIN